MRPIVICFILLLVMTAAFASSDLILQDEFEGVTMGRSSGVSYAPGVGGLGVTFDGPSDSVQYNPDEFAPHVGSIEFDFKLTQPVTPDHKAWCLLSDFGDKVESPGTVVLRWPEASGRLEFGISDGKVFHWCRSRREDWLPEKWYHLKLIYGAEGMRLEIDGRQEGLDPYNGGLASTPKKLGYDDSIYDSPPVTIDNLRTYKSNVDYLTLEPAELVVVKGETAPVCTVTYSLAETGAVLLEVLGPKNKPVRTILDDAIQPAGEYTLKWSPEGLKDGEYTVRLLRATPTKVKGLTGKVSVINQAPKTKK